MINLDFATLVPGSGPTEPTYLYRATVVGVVDGNTVDLAIDLGFNTRLDSQRIRLEHVPNKNQKDQLSKLVLGEQVVVRITKGSESGWQGRLFLNGNDVNELMFQTHFSS